MPVPRGEKDLAGAWGWLRWALARDPEHAEAVNMQGILLHGEGRFAGGSCRVRAGRGAGQSRRGLEPRKLVARFGPHGRGSAGARAGRRARSIASRSALQPCADAAAAGRLGARLAGLRGALAISRGAPMAANVLSQPRWRGEPLDGRRVLLHAEQGLGDTIQFCRFRDVGGGSRRVGHSCRCRSRSSG